MRTGFFRLVLLLIALPGVSLAACAQTEPDGRPVPGPPVPGEGFVLPQLPDEPPGGGEWRAFRCDGETTAFVTAPVADSMGDEAVAFALTPDPVPYRLPAQGEGVYGNGMVRVRFVEDALEVGTDTRPTGRCVPELQAPALLDDESGLRFVVASGEPVPGWSPVFQERTGITYWLGPGRMRVAPGELRRVVADSDPVTDEPVLVLELQGDAVDRFAYLTGHWTDRPLAVVVDGRVMLAPTIMERIVGGRISLTGLSPEEMAQTRTALEPLLAE